MDDYQVISRAPRAAVVGVRALSVRRLDTDHYDPLHVERILRAHSECRFPFAPLRDVCETILCFGAYALTKHVDFQEPTAETVPYICSAPVGS